MIYDLPTIQFHKPEITTNGRTIWVNSTVTGGCLGRFCPASGEVFLEGRTITTKPVWVEWTNEMYERYAISIPFELKPVWTDCKSKS